jgi:hypothetical protein
LLESHTKNLAPIPKESTGSWSSKLTSATPTDEDESGEFPSAAKLRMKLSSPLDVGKRLPLRLILQRNVDTFFTGPSSQSCKSDTSAADRGLHTLRLLSVALATPGGRSSSLLHFVSFFLFFFQCCILCGIYI